MCSLILSGFALLVLLDYSQLKLDSEDNQTMADIYFTVKSL